MLFFVAGITGKVGGATARHLLAGGHTVRALVRDPAKPAAAQFAARGVELRQGDLTDATAVAAALAGCDGAFLMLPPVAAPSPGFREARAVIDSYAAALRKSPPPRLVALSSIGSEQPHGLGLITSTHLMEESMAALSLPTAFLRAGGFLENYAYGLRVATAVTPGSFPMLLDPTSRQIPMVATDDIGRVAARQLAGPGWAGVRVLEIGSPTSSDDLAAAIGGVLGRPVKAAAVPRDQWAATLEGMGLPPGGTAAYEEMMDGFNSGWIHFGVEGAEPAPATLTPADVYAAAYKASQAAE